jgi:hypothetical protein
MGGDSHRQELVDADAQGVKDGRVQLLQWTVYAFCKDGIVGALPAKRAVAELRGETGVPLVQLVVPNPRRQDQVRVRILGGDCPQDLESHQPGGVGPPRAL